MRTWPILKAVTRKTATLVAFGHERVKEHKLQKLEVSAPFTVATAHILRWSEDSGFVRTVPPNTKVLLRGLWLCGKIRSWQEILESKRKLGGNHAFYKRN